MPGQPIEIILMRELADHLATADLRRRRPTATCSSTTSRRKSCSVAASTRPARCRSRSGRRCSRRPTSRGAPLPPESCRWRSRSREQRPAQGHMWIRGLDGVRRRLRSRPSRLKGQWGDAARRGRDLLGRRSEGHALGHARLAGDARDPRPSATAATPRASRCAAPPDTRHRARRRHRHPPARRTRSAPRCARVDMLLTHLHMDHIQGLGFFDAAVPPRLRGAHLGSGLGDRRPADPPHPLHVAAAVPRPPARAAVRPAPARHPPRARSRSPASTVRAALGLPSRADRRLPPRRRRTGSLAYLPDHEPTLASHRFAVRPGVVLGARARGRRGRADPRRAVHRRRSTRARRLGPQHARARARVRRAGARRLLRALPPRSRARRRHARRLLPRRTGERPRHVRRAPAHEGDVFEVGPRT